MGVNFDNFHLNDFKRSINIEEIFKFYGSFAGIHDFNFDALFSMSGSSGWSSASATASYPDSNTVELDAGTLPAGWYTTEQSATITTSFRATYHKTDYRQGFEIILPDGDTYLAVTDSSGYPLILKKNGASWDTLQSISIATPQEADVIVSFRQVQFGDDQDEFWRCISVYMNEALITTYMELSSSPINGDLQIGLAVYGGDTLSYDSLRVGELTLFAEYGTLDPGEPPIGGVQRSIEGMYIQFRVRHDGSLRAHRVKAIESSKTFSEPEIDSMTPSSDFRELKTHVRMMGAYIWAEAQDNDLIQIIGHRFLQTDNPMLLSEEECYTEAVKTLKRMQEACYVADVETTYSPILEVEDRIILPGTGPDFNPDNDWIISGISINGDIATLMCRLSLRKYVWGT